MKRECAWCGRMLGQSVPQTGDELTYGICPQCNKEMLTLADLGVNAHREQDGATATKDEGLASVLKRQALDARFSAKQAVTEPRLSFRDAAKNPFDRELRPKRYPVVAACQHFGFQSPS